MFHLSIVSAFKRISMLSPFILSFILSFDIVNYVSTHLQRGRHIGLPRVVCPFVCLSATLWFPLSTVFPFYFLKMQSYSMTHDQTI